MAEQNAELELVDRWRSILAMHAHTVCELDREMHQHGIGASDFEVLDVLAEGVAEDGGDACRVQELAARVHLSQSALSRLLGRLEKDGLVVRAMCEQDRRGVKVCLTGKGRTLRDEVLPLQRAVLKRTLDSDGASGG